MDAIPPPPHSFYHHFPTFMRSRRRIIIILIHPRQSLLPGVCHHTFQSHPPRPYLTLIPYHLFYNRSPSCINRIVSLHIHTTSICFPGLSSTFPVAAFGTFPLICLLLYCQTSQFRGPTCILRAQFMFLRLLQLPCFNPVHNYWPCHCTPSTGCKVYIVVAGMVFAPSNILSPNTPHSLF